MTPARPLLASMALLALCACSRSEPSKPGSAGASAPPGSAGAFAPDDRPSMAAPASPGGASSSSSSAGAGAPVGLTLQAINSAQFGATPPSASPSAKVADPVLIRAEVMLDRANFGPGVIDGRMGQNVKHALIAYDKAHNLSPSSELDEAAWRALTAADTAPALKTYALTAQDVAGPWSPDVGEDFVKMSQQSALGYTSPVEMLAERFHMDQDLLKTLNPQADFAKAGTVIVVVDPQRGALPAVSRIEVDKAKAEVFAYGADDKLLAVFPATVGSTERPSPKGTWKVKGVAKAPDYVYDPAKLTWGPKKAGKLHIPPGPNSPVGAVWIALTAPDYGIHGTPDPHTIGKTASHGCVRLANWDAEALSQAVKPGVKVTFIGS